MIDLAYYLRSPNHLFSYPVRSFALSVASWCALVSAVLAAAFSVIPATERFASGAVLAYFALLLGGLELAARARGLGGLLAWHRREQRRQTLAAVFAFLQRFGDRALEATKSELERRGKELEDRRNSWSAIEKTALALLAAALVGSTGLFVDLLLQGIPGAGSLYCAVLLLTLCVSSMAWAGYPYLRRRVGRLRTEIELLHQIQLALVAGSRRIEGPSRCRSRSARVSKSTNGDL